MAEPIAPAANQRSRMWRPIRFSWIRWLSILSGLVVWELLGKAKVSVIIPSATQTVAALAKMLQQGDLLANLVTSMGGFLAGFGLAVVIGVPLGALMARYPTVEYFFDIYILAGMSAPTLAFLPLLVIVFGINQSARIAVSFVFAFWVIVANTYSGVRGANRSLVDMATSFGASENQLFWRIMLPSGLELIMSGLRLGASRAVKGVINGEMLITIIGLGAMIQTSAATYNGPTLFSVLAAICMVAIFVDQGLRWLHRAVTPWSARS